MDNLKMLIDGIENDLKDGEFSMLGLFKAGIALKFISDRLLDIDGEQAQRCNNLCHFILEGKK